MATLWAVIVLASACSGVAFAEFVIADVNIIIGNSV